PQASRHGEEALRGDLRRDADELSRANDGAVVETAPPESKGAAMAIPRTRPGNYPAFLSYGFRPFFLLGSIWGGLTVLVWLPILTGSLETASLFAPVDWHAHE